MPRDSLSMSGDRYEIEPGALVSIFIIEGAGELIFEGRAIVISLCRHDRFFHRVRFLSERVDRIRLVLPPSPHESPLLFTEAMRELLRTRGLSPWSDFFPDD